ncbi:MAG: acyl-CoA reductase [Bacteroidota bacterium]
METEDRIRSFIQLGVYLRDYNDDPENLFFHPLAIAAQQAFTENPWFTSEHIKIALKSIGLSLEEQNLRQWLTPYLHQFSKIMKPGIIGVVMPGNIPAVGFHDFICVLISGNKIKLKLSSSDKCLLPEIARMLVQIKPSWESQIEFISGKLDNFDAVIATGSNNTSRYFEFYFGKYPNIIRKNRNSVAVLSGNESDSVLSGLASDIMLYFGLGCRSVSKLFIPVNYDFTKLKEALAPFSYLFGHNKYANNYDYQKSIFIINKIPFIDTGFLLIREDRSLNSPLAVLNYQVYDHIEEVSEEISSGLESIQCIVSDISLPFPTVLPGNAQFPALWDYADHVDTLSFLLSCCSS